jgi:hypothetical protein
MRREIPFCLPRVLNYSKIRVRVLTSITMGFLESLFSNSGFGGVTKNFIINHSWIGISGVLNPGLTNGLATTKQTERCRKNLIRNLT